MAGVKRGCCGVSTSCIGITVLLVLALASLAASLLFLSSTTLFFGGNGKNDGLVNGKETKYWERVPHASVFTELNAPLLIPSRWGGDDVILPDVCLVPSSSVEKEFRMVGLSEESCGEGMEDAKTAIWNATRGRGTCIDGSRSVELMERLCARFPQAHACLRLYVGDVKGSKTPFPFEPVRWEPLGRVVTLDIPAPTHPYHSSNDALSAAAVALTAPEFGDAYIWHDSPRSTTMTEIAGRLWKAVMVPLEVLPLRMGGKPFDSTFGVTRKPMFCFDSIRIIQPLRVPAGLKAPFPSMFAAIAHVFGASYSASRALPAERFDLTHTADGLAKVGRASWESNGLIDPCNWNRDLTAEPSPEDNIPTPCRVNPLPSLGMAPSHARSGGLLLQQVALRLHTGTPDPSRTNNHPLRLNRADTLLIRGKSCSSRKPPPPNLPLEQLRASPSLSPPLVLVVQRSDRKIVNVNQLTQLIASFGMDVRIWKPEEVALSEQVHMVQAADVFIANHGLAQFWAAFKRHDAFFVNLCEYIFSQTRCPYFENVATAAGQPPLRTLRHISRDSLSKDNMHVDDAEINSGDPKMSVLTYRTIVRKTYHDYDITVDIEGFKQFWESEFGSGVDGFWNRWCQQEDIAANDMRLLREGL